MSHHGGFLSHRIDRLAHDSRLDPFLAAEETAFVSLGERIDAIGSQISWAAVLSLRHDYRTGEDTKNGRS